MKETISLIEQHAQAKKELNTLRRTYFDIEASHGESSNEALQALKSIHKYRKLITSLENKLNPKEDKTALSLRYN